MGAAYFYHLTQSRPEDTLRGLLGKARQAGWRVAVRGRSEEEMARLDELLWLGPEEGFLAHGFAGGPHDAAQPVLLTTSEKIANGATCVMCVDGADISPDEVMALDRVCILFNGHDDMAVEGARGQWRRLTKANCQAQYWSEEGGGWQKKAESGGSDGAS